MVDPELTKEAYAADPDKYYGKVAEFTYSTQETGSYGENYCYENFGMLQFVEADVTDQRNFGIMFCDPDKAEELSGQIPGGATVKMRGVMLAYSEGEPYITETDSWSGELDNMLVMAVFDYEIVQ